MHFYKKWRGQAFNGPKPPFLMIEMMRFFKCFPQTSKYVNPHILLGEQSCYKSNIYDQLWSIYVSINKLRPYNFWSDDRAELYRNSEWIFCQARDLGPTTPKYEKNRL